MATLPFNKIASTCFFKFGLMYYCHTTCIRHDSVFIYSYVERKFAKSNNSVANTDNITFPAAKQHNPTHSRNRGFPIYRGKDTSTARRQVPSNSLPSSSFLFLLFLLSCSVIFLLFPGSLLCRKAPLPIHCSRRRHRSVKSQTPLLVATIQTIRVCYCLGHWIGSMDMIDKTLTSMMMTNWLQH